MEELAKFYYNQALLLARSGNLEKAVDFCAKCLGIDNSLTECSILAGLCYYKLGRLKMAQYCLQGVPEFDGIITDKYILKKAYTLKNIVRMLFK